MLEVSALSPASPLLKAAGLPGENNGETGISSGFAALLALETGSEPAPQPQVPPVAALVQPAMARQTGKADGKADGKILPDSLQPTTDGNPDEYPLPAELALSAFATFLPATPQTAAATAPAAAGASSQTATSQPATAQTAAPQLEIATEQAVPGAKPAIGPTLLVLPGRAVALPGGGNVVSVEDAAPADQPAEAKPTANAAALATISAVPAQSSRPVSQVRSSTARAVAERSTASEAAPAATAANAGPAPAAAAIQSAEVLPALIAPADGAAQAAPLANPVVTTAAPVAQPRHDFAALVDRLTEARDIALSGQPAQTVHAAIAHDVFGEVSMRFEAGSAGLSVALTSADPDFARAVQAAAPAASGTASGENPAPSPRQNDSGQQTGGSAAFLANDNSQPQSTNSHNSHARGGSPSAARAHFQGSGGSDDAVPTRSGGEIFA